MSEPVEVGQVWRFEPVTGVVDAATFRVLAISEGTAEIRVMGGPFDGEVGTVPVRHLESGARGRYRLVNPVEDGER